ncbi:MAG: hypothetical protein Q9162_007778 [Coniocarpon cinnabarinum]
MAASPTAAPTETTSLDRVTQQASGRVFQNYIISAVNLMRYWDTPAPALFNLLAFSNRTTLYGASTTPRLEAMGNAEAKAQSDPSSSTAPPIRIAAADAMQILQLEPALNEWQAAHPHDVHAMLCNASKAARRLTRKIGFDERSAELYLKMQAADEKHDAHG